MSEDLLFRPFNDSPNTLKHMKQLLLAMGVTLLLVVPIMASPHFKNDRGFKKEFFQAKIITGKVTNDKGEPLANVTVQVKGSNKSTVTNADGSFSIDLP